MLVRYRSAAAAWRAWYSATSENMITLLSSTPELLRAGELDHVAPSCAQAARALERVRDVGLDPDRRRPLRERDRHARERSRTGAAPQSADRPAARAAASAESSRRRRGRGRRAGAAVGERAGHRPGVVERDASGTIPRIGTRPRVGLTALTPVRAAGCAATRRCRCPGGRDHPGGDRRAGPAAGSPRGSREVPRIPDLVGRSAAANSCVWVWPTRTMPSSRNRSHATALLRDVSAEHAARRGQGQPSTANRSLRRSGCRTAAARRRPHARGARPRRRRDVGQLGYSRTNALTASGDPSNVGSPPLRSAIRCIPRRAAHGGDLTVAQCRGGLEQPDPRVVTAAWSRSDHPRGGAACTKADTLEAVCPHFGRSPTDQRPQHG